MREYKPSIRIGSSKLDPGGDPDTKISSISKRRMGSGIGLRGLIPDISMIYIR
jgi:hypothetical protein